MTSTDRLERNLTQLLEHLYLGPRPTYADDALKVAVSGSRRPGWTMPERWLPMSALTERMASGPRVPWRTVGVVALLILALAVAMVVVGSQQHRLPAPYGPAGNGLIAYSAGGDIFVGDPITRETRRITMGPETDVNPSFSRHGAKLVFWRSTSSSSDLYASGYVMGANPDGSGLHRLGDVPLVDITGADGSGDGRQNVAVSLIDGRQTMTMFDVESGQSRVLDVGMPVEDGLAAFRPPDGDEILFLGRDTQGPGIFVVGADGSNLRAVIRSADGFQQPSWSPDGSRIAYSQFDPSNGRVFTHIVEADGGRDVILKNPAGVIYQVAYGGPNIWSPDGRSLLIGRGYWEGPAIVPPGTEPDEFRLAIIAVDGSVPDRELTPSNFSFGSGWGWSPDGTKVVTSLRSSFEAVDIATGEEEFFGGWIQGQWQRVAP